jgi:hypothetical protein
VDKVRDKATFTHNSPHSQHSQGMMGLPSQLQLGGESSSRRSPRPGMGSGQLGAGLCVAFDSAGGCEMARIGWVLGRHRDAAEPSEPSGPSRV